MAMAAPEKRAPTPAYLEPGRWSPLQHCPEQHVGNQQQAPGVAGCTCRWMHKCLRGSHPSIRCFSRRAKHQRPCNPPPPGPQLDLRPPLARPLGLGSKLPSPVSLEALCSILDGYDNNLMAYILYGFTHVFQIDCVGLPPQRGEVVINLKSADEFAEVIDRKLAK